VLLDDSVPANAIAAAFAAGQLLISTATLAELSAVLSRSRFDRYCSVERRTALLEAVRLHAELVIVTSDVHACGDPKDNKFLALALDGRADLILTGDRDLLALHPFRDIDILTPAQFLERAAG
jgi:putative PIN family toxin of toxin-antitoxin system